MRRSTLVVIVALLAGCASVVQNSLNQQLTQLYGPADPTRFDRTASSAAPAASEPTAVSYHRDIRPVLERRCVVCHGCYDAPCQLKLTSWDGIVRGGSKAQVYDPYRLDEAPLTRLYEDAQQASEWRAKGFHPVLNERTPSPGNNLAASVLYRAIELKRAHPLPDAPLVPKELDVSMDRKQSCPRLDEYDGYAKDNPLGGMPLGLPGLTDREIEQVSAWLAAGSPDDTNYAVPAHIGSQVQEWERFLNGDSLKEQLMSRYVYEHLFLGHLSFEGDAHNTAFHLIRSSTPPGQPARRIATRRPYDDPGASRVYYRLEADRETRLAKTRMPYVLSPARMAKYRGWFLSAQVRVSALPSYNIEQASNPFITYAAIPPEARYRFMLDEAQFFVMTFIKGPVCRGQSALNVIDDRFWVFFFDPHASADEDNAEALQRQAHSLRLPASFGSEPPLTSWNKLATQEKDILAAKSAYFNQRFGGQRRLMLSDIWNGDGHNANAGLTILRQFDSASVVKGLVGDQPKTAWVMSYPLFERIYYLLVAGYDVYGNVMHQLNSRLYMDFMRMEGEANFLMLLPKASRDATRDFWYRDVSDGVKDYVNGNKTRFEGETGIHYRTDAPQSELYGLLSQRLAPALDRRFDMSAEPDATLRRDLQALAQVRGASLSLLPETVFLQITDARGGPHDGPLYFTLIRNTGHKNVSHLLREASALLPAENTLTVVPGFIGAYPNAILRAKAADVPTITAMVADLQSEADYRALADRFAVRRTNPEFWAVSDALIDAYQKWSPLEAGLFDYNRLANR